MSAIECRYQRGHALRGLCHLVLVESQRVLLLAANLVQEATKACGE
jgi:hypothetical protein